MPAVEFAVLLAYAVFVFVFLIAAMWVHPPVGS